MRQYRHYQGGAALLLIAAAMIVAASVLSYQLLGGLGAKLKRQNAQEMSQALADAKENLLVFAASLPELYDVNTGIGYMPTPDFDNDGRQGNFSELPNIWYNTNNNNVIGRLPALNKNTNPFYFMSRQCAANGSSCVDEGTTSLWVAFSGRAGNGDLRLQNKSKLNATDLKINLDANADGLLSAADCNTKGIVCVDNVPVVAVVIAAGEPLVDQTTRHTAATNFAQYLDMNNADANLYRFVSRFPAGQTCDVDNNGQPDDNRLCFNDRVVSITYDEWTLAMERVARQYCSVPIKPAWFTTNEWSYVCVP